MSRLSKHLASDARGRRARSCLPLPARPDELLPLARAATDDADAAATLVGALCGGMLRIVRKVLGRRHPDVDDVTQDAVIALLTALMTFRGECSVEHFANRDRAADRAGGAPPGARAGAHGGGRDGVVRRGRRRRDRRTRVAAGGRRSRRAGALLVRQLLDELPDVIAEALASHFILGYTVDEIAAASSVPANTVWSRLRLGKQALRRKLERDAELAEMLEVAR